MKPELIHDMYPPASETHAIAKEATMSEIPLAIPVDELRPRQRPTVEEPPLEVDEHTTLGLVELLLKSPGRVNALARDEGRQAELVPRYLGIALVGFTAFAATMALILTAADPAARPNSIVPTPAAHWSPGSATALIIAYNLGLIGTTGICLPSFYFFGLLSGVRMTFLQVIGQIMRCKATSAVTLLGILPIYVAAVLGLIVFEAPADLLEQLLYVGLVLPFIAGLWGVGAMFRCVLGFADQLPPDKRCQRSRFLARLTLAWAAVFTAVSPVLIYRLWEGGAWLLGG